MFPLLNHWWILISRETHSRKSKTQSYLICHDFNLTSMAGGVRREDGHGTARGLHLTSERYWGKIFGAAVPWDGEAGRLWAGRTTPGPSARRAPRKAGVWWACRLGMGGPNPSAFILSIRQGTHKAGREQSVPARDEHRPASRKPDGAWRQRMPTAWALQSGWNVAEDRFTPGVLQGAEDTVAIHIVMRLKCFSLTKCNALMFKQN